MQLSKEGSGLSVFFAYPYHIVDHDQEDAIASARNEGCVVHFGGVLGMSVKGAEMPVLVDLSQLEDAATRDTSTENDSSFRW